MATMLYVMPNYLFVNVGNLDFNRRFQMITACGALITPIKSTFELKYRILPTLDLSNKKCFHTWFNLRVCILDLGMKYKSRIIIYSSAFLGLYTIYAAILVLSYFGFMFFKLTLYFIVLGLYDITYVFYNIVRMFYFGAKINQKFIDDKFELTKIKSSLVATKLNLDEVLSD